MSVIDQLATQICQETFDSSDQNTELLKQVLEQLQDLDVPTRIKCVWKISETVEISQFLEVLSVSEIENKEWMNILRVLLTLSSLSDVPNLCSLLAQNGLFKNIQQLFYSINKIKSKELKEIHRQVIDQMGVIVYEIVSSLKQKELNKFMSSDVLKQMIVCCQIFPSSKHSIMINSINKLIQSTVQYVGTLNQSNSRSVSKFLKRSRVSDFVRAHFASPQTVVAIRMQSSFFYRPVKLTQRSSLTKLTFNTMGSTKSQNICSNPTCKKNENTENRKFSKCSRCRNAKYCSKQCQKQHWEIHSEYCSASNKNKISF